MPLLETDIMDINTHARNMKCEMSSTFLTIHDEGDFICDRAILYPLTKKMSTLLDISEYYRKGWHKFIRYLFDVEYDEWGSFTALKSIPVYEEPINRAEHEAIKLYKEGLKLVSKSYKTEDTKTEKVEAKEVTIDLKASECSSEELITSLEGCKEGEVVIRVLVDIDKTLKFYKKLDTTELDSVIDLLGLEII